MYHISCILYPEFCMLYPVSCLMYRSCILYPVSCILYPVSCILYPISYILYPVSCILYPVSCILYPISCIPSLVSWNLYLIALSPVFRICLFTEFPKYVLSLLNFVENQYFDIFSLNFFIAFTTFGNSFFQI